MEEQARDEEKNINFEEGLKESKASSCMKEDDFESNQPMFKRLKVDEAGVLV